jgi:hypothetical protein
MNHKPTQQKRERAFELIKEKLPDDINVFMFSKDNLIIGVMISDDWRMQMKWLYGKVTIELCMRPKYKGVSWIPHFKQREKYCGPQTDPQAVADLFVAEVLRCKEYTPAWRFNKSDEEVQEYVSQQPGAYQVWVMPYDAPNKHQRYKHDE